MAIIPSKSKILSHPSLNLLETEIIHPYWTHIINLKLTSNVQLLKVSIMLRYHLRFRYINLSLLRTPQEYGISLCGVLFSDTDIAPVIESMINKKPIINWDCCGMINHISDKCMPRGPVFQTPNICHQFAQYNSKNGSTPKLELIHWKPNPPIDQNNH